MNVALISPYRRIGEDTVASKESSALNMVAEALCEELARSEARVKVFAPHHRAIDDPSWKDGEVEIHPVRARVSALTGYEIASRIPQDFSVVHLQHELYGYGGLAGAVTLPRAIELLRRRGHRVLTTIHGVLELGTIDLGFLRSYKVPGTVSMVRKLYKSLMRQICDASDVVHVHEPRFKELLVDEYGVQNRIEIIPLGIKSRPAEMSKIEARRRMDLPAVGDVLCFFGFLFRRKGIFEFLECIPELLERNARLSIVVGGDLPERAGDRAEILARLSALKGTERFRYRGFLSESDTTALMTASDVMLLPYTLAMSSSGPMTQAIGHDLPVLLSNRFRNILPEAPNCFDPTPKGIVEITEAYFKSPGVRESAARYRDDLLAKRSWSVVARRLMSEYGRLECNPCS